MKTTRLLEATTCSASWRPLLLEQQTRKEVAGVVLEPLTPSQNIRLGDYTLHVAGSGARRLHPGGPGLSSDGAR